MISMISEARARFLFEFGIRETAQDGIGIIVTDLATTYKAEGHARDQLLFEVGVMDFNKYGGDITFRISRPQIRRRLQWQNQVLCFLTTSWEKSFLCRKSLKTNLIALTGWTDAQKCKIRYDHHN
jgi:acyl-CoA thioesterase FadM